MAKCCRHKITRAILAAAQALSFAVFIKGVATRDLEIVTFATVAFLLSDTQRRVLRLEEEAEEPRDKSSNE